ncbi:hypothetical protein [Polynucleobacter sp. AP-Nino-20-G2]|uniref:hypothetical protein n=1 Tax=Polynucleobacter sp. AP-Nino-20-G2 TaxID=2576917 RepID=UPI001BFD9FA2|nr:hypothetical protein [Polynucleobacter sp. AP-Nino-20-G2]QWE15720.1 hypothetical protein FD960_05250 [Polynucleobacter sp. AP-Nino-20-G2]
MCRFLGFFLTFCLALPAGAAGLGFNPFEKSSPTSAGATQNNRPAGPASGPAPKGPAPTAGPKTQPATPPTNNSTPQQTKK